MSALTQCRFHANTTFFFCQELSCLILVLQNKPYLRQITSIPLIRNRSDLPEQSSVFNLAVEGY